MIISCKKNKTPKYISRIIIISGGVTAESYLLYTYVEKYYISIGDKVVAKVVPNIQKLDGVDVLVQAYCVDQEIRKRQSPNLAEQEILKGAIDNVYMENSRLINMYRNKKQKSQELKTKNKMLKLKNEPLKKK